MKVEKKENFMKIMDRINYLYKNKKGIEAIIFFGMILESALISLINEYEKRFINNLKTYNINFNLYKYKNNTRNINDVSLSKIKDYFSVFISDEKLISNITSLINLRNKCAHNLLYEDIDCLNKIIMRDFLKHRKTIATLYGLKKDFLENDLKDLELKKFAIEMLKKNTKQVSVGIINGVPTIIKTKKERSLADGSIIFACPVLSKKK